MSQLTLRLLGPPEVRAGGQPLTFPTRKALALLIYLAVEGGRQPRDHLAALLWPESDPSRARATLRNGLHQLRSTLPDDGFLHVERDALGFNFASDYELDLERVTTAIPLESTIETLQVALEVYRGDFLEGFSLGDTPVFDDWVSVQREHWHRRVDELFDRLSRRQFEQGQIRPSLETTNRWLAHNPLNEAAHRRLMRLHTAAGNRTAAWQAYETCRTILAEELAIDPSPETKALASQIDDLRLTIDDWRQHSNRQSSIVNLKFSAGPLVGRSQEFTALVEAYHQAGQGEPRLVSIVGEAGIGKTRLATDFLAWAAAQGADVIRGRSFESGRQLPYQPIVDALRPRLEAINAPEDYLSDTWLAELSRLLPELRDRYPDLQPAGLDETIARPRLFEAVTRFMLSLAGRMPAGTPFLLFLDDLQWADAASLDVLQYACRRWQENEAPLLLLVTVRAEALHPLSVAHAPQLADCLQGLARHLPVTTLSLEPLTAAAVGQFVAAFGGGEADPFVRWIFGQTNGQPFYLVAMLEDLRQQGLVKAGVDASGRWQWQSAVPEDDRHRATAANVPEKVRQVIAGRLARLSPAAFDWLAASSVLAQDITFELLCRVTAVAEDVGLRALDELLRSQLLRESGSTYLFAHDKIRDVAYTEAGDARRRIFHRRALAALADQKASSALLTRHALAAGDQERAFHYALAAGDEALSLFAARNAIDHYEQARTLISTVHPPLATLQTLYLQLGRAYELVGDYAAALAVYDELQTAAQKRDDRPLELAALMARTTVYAAPTQHYDPEHVAILTNQALPLARELGDHAAEAKIQWNLMLLRLFTGELGEAVAAGEASLAIARRYDLRERMAYALHDLTRAYLFTGQPEAGIEAGLEAQALWRELDNKAMLTDNLITISSMRNFWQGLFEETLPHLHEALALSREIDNLWNQSYANHVLGTVYFGLGRFGEAIEACEAAIEWGEQAGFMVPTFVNGSILATIYCMVGHPERGWRWVERALEEETAMKDQQAGPLAAQALIHLHQGDLEKADEAIRRSYDHMELRSLSAAVFFTFPTDGRLRLARGEYEQALRVSEQFYEHLQQTKLRLFRSDALLLRGQALLALGRPDEAQAALAQARTEAEAVDDRRILWEVLAALAEVAEEQGEEETAVSLRQQAREVIDFIADHIDDPKLKEGFVRETAVYLD